MEPVERLASKLLMEGVVVQISGLSVVLALMLLSIFNLSYVYNQEKYSKAANLWGASFLTAFYGVLLWLVGAWG